MAEVQRFWPRFLGGRLIALPLPIGNVGRNVRRREARHAPAAEPRFERALDDRVFHVDVRPQPVDLVVGQEIRRGILEAQAPDRRADLGALRHVAFSRLQKRLRVLLFLGT